MSEDKPEYRLGPDGHTLLRVVEDAEKCKHMDVVNRYGPVSGTPIQYVCQGCKEKVMVRIVSYVVMLPEELKEWEKAVAAQQAASISEMRRKRVGLVLPDEVRKQQQQK